MNQPEGEAGLVKKEESDNFMQEDEIAFIISEDYPKNNSVVIIGKMTYDKIIKSQPKKKNGITSKIIKFKNEQNACTDINNGFQIDNEKIINVKDINVLFQDNIVQNMMELNADNQHLVVTGDKSIKFSSENGDAVNCTTSVIVNSGTLNGQSIENTVVKSEGGKITISQLGGKPRRKRNKASMKKYKKRKSSTGKKKKIPRRRSRKLRRK